MNHGTQRRERGHFWTHIESISDLISSAITSSLKWVHPEEKLVIPPKKKIEFKGISGDIKIIGSNSETIQIEKDGFARITEQNDKLKIKGISADIKIIAPKKIDLEIKAVSGNLAITNIQGEIDLSSVSGDITGKELMGSFIGEIACGDIYLDYQEIGTIKIRSRRGDVTLGLNEKLEAEIEIATDEGTISCEFHLKDEVRKENYLKGILNKPKAKIEIKTDYGDVKIKKRA